VGVYLSERARDNTGKFLTLVEYHLGRIPKSLPPSPPGLAASPYYGIVVFCPMNLLRNTYCRMPAPRAAAMPMYRLEEAGTGSFSSVVK